MPRNDETSSNPNDLGNMAIVVAHPGHELLVHHHLERYRPLYFCLTDGSGAAGQSRLESTGRLLQRAGARPGSIYGRFSDREVYNLLLDGRAEVFSDLVRELAERLIDADIQWIAGDAMEGFNPGHDLCRALIDDAVAIVNARTGRLVENYEFAVHNEPPQKAVIRLQLDEAALERKIAAAMVYSEIRDDVQETLTRLGRQSFAVESLQPSSAREVMERFEITPPEYETLGESRVRDGRYRRVIRYHDHVLPIFRAIREQPALR
jgi:AcrR family transcriptional regulator